MVNSGQSWFNNGLIVVGNCLNFKWLVVTTKWLNIAMVDWLKLATEVEQMDIATPSHRCRKVRKLEIYENMWINSSNCHPGGTLFGIFLGVAVDMFL